MSGDGRFDLQWGEGIRMSAEGVATLQLNVLTVITRNSARLTDQRGSYAFSCSPFSIHVCHLLRTFSIDILVYYLFSRHQWTAYARAMNTVLLFNAPPPKKMGAKNMQNFVRFYATSEFDREYLQNDSRYPKMESYFFQSASSCILWKRSHELWSTNYRDLDVNLDTLKCTFWETIFRPLGGAAPWNLYTR